METTNSNFFQKGNITVNLSLISAIECRDNFIKFIGSTMTHVMYFESDDEATKAYEKILKTANPIQL